MDVDVTSIACRLFSSAISWRAGCQLWTNAATQKNSKRRLRQAVPRRMQPQCQSMILERFAAIPAFYERCSFNMDCLGLSTIFCPGPKSHWSLRYFDIARVICFAKFFGYHNFVRKILVWAHFCCTKGRSRLINIKEVILHSKLLKYECQRVSPF